MVEVQDPATPPLPGEHAPLDPATRPYGQPVTDAEALGVARRVARKALSEGRRRSSMAVPVELPPADAPSVMSAWRLPARLLMRARAKAELEGVTLTRVLGEALSAYASSSPGATVQYRAMPGGVHATASGPTRRVLDATRRTRTDAEIGRD
ncbi:hypothetical protein [Actinotalea sp. JY-7876]|uniref:hypothetical protein n=1 Tax=Actinotalea sp. JY-7876 TaxID=2758442 RepID=UPI0015F7683F|nr:hypothetical protein [Actinotalea sp. JY-7876]